MRKNLWVITFTFLFAMVFLFASAPQEASASKSFGEPCAKSGCHAADDPRIAPAPKAPAPKPAAPKADPAPKAPAPAPKATPAPAPAAPAYEAISVAINGKDTNILMLNGRALLSARGLGELIGADVSWDNETQGISFTLEGKTVTMFLNKEESKVNGSDVKAPFKAQTIDGNNVVPVRFVAESLGLTVHYTATGIAIY